MTRHLRLVAEGGNLVKPQSAKPRPRISIDADLVDLAINVLDLLIIASRKPESLGVHDAGGCPSDGHPKPSKPTKTKGAQQP